MQIRRKSANVRLDGNESAVTKSTVSFAIWCKSKKSEQFGADGQNLFVLVNRQTVFPTRCDRRAVAFATGVVADPFERLCGKPLVEKSVDAPRVSGQIADDVVVHHRVDAVRILMHQTPAADHVARHRSAVERRLCHNLLRTRLLTDIQWSRDCTRTPHFRRSYVKGNRVSKSEAARKVEHAYHF